MRIAWWFLQDLSVKINTVTAKSATGRQGRKVTIRNSNFGCGSNNSGLLNDCSRNSTCLDTRPMIRKFRIKVKIEILRLRPSSHQVVSQTHYVACIEILQELSLVQNLQIVFLKLDRNVCYLLHILSRRHSALMQLFCTVLLILIREAYHLGLVPNAIWIFYARK